MAQLDIAVDAILPAEIDESPRPGGTAALCRAHGGGEIGAGGGPAAGGPGPGGRYRGRCRSPHFAKRGTAAAAVRLDLLSGRGHRVRAHRPWLARGLGAHAFGANAVGFKRLRRPGTPLRLASGEWRGKAGGYAIQGRAAAFATRLNGSYSNVVGLDLHGLPVAQGRRRGTISDQPVTCP